MNLREKLVRHSPVVRASAPVRSYGPSFFPFPFYPSAPSPARRSFFYPMRRTSHAWRRRRPPQRQHPPSARAATVRQSHLPAAALPLWISAATSPPALCRSTRIPPLAPHLRLSPSAPSPNPTRTLASSTPFPQSRIRSDFRALPIPRSSNPNCRRHPPSSRRRCLPSAPWPPFKPPSIQPWCHHLHHQLGEVDPVAVVASSTTTTQHHAVCLRHGRQRPRLRHTLGHRRLRPVRQRRQPPR
jgi:hypothetical protein